MKRTVHSFAVAFVALACLMGCDIVGQEAEEYIDETAEDILNPTPTSSSETTAQAEGTAPSGGSARESGSTERQSDATPPRQVLADLNLAPSSPYDDLLSKIPDLEGIVLYISDYVKIRDAFGIALSGPDDEGLEKLYGELDSRYMPGQTEFVLFTEDVYLGPLHSHATGRNEAVNQNLRYLGFDYLDMDRSITTGKGDSQMGAIEGRFDPELTHETLMSCSECPPLKVEEYRGVGFYSWGEDYRIYFDQRFQPPVFDHTGRGGRVAVLDEYLYHTIGTPEMKEMIDTGLAGSGSMADLQEVRFLADGLSRLGAYSMIIRNVDEPLEMHGPPNITYEDWKKMQEEMGPWLRPYSAYAVGIGLDKNGSFMALVIVHGDRASAEDNVRLLRRIVEEEGSILDAGTLDDIRPWRDLIDLESAEIHASGVLLLATLRGAVTRDGNWMRLTYLGDSLFWAE